MKKKIILTQSKKLTRIMRRELQIFGGFSKTYLPFERHQLFVNNGPFYNPYEWAKQILKMNPSKQSRILRAIISCNQTLFPEYKSNHRELMTHMHYRVRMACSEHCKGPMNKTNL